MPRCCNSITYTSCWIVIRSSDGPNNSSHYSVGVRSQRYSVHPCCYPRVWCHAKKKRFIITSTLRDCLLKIVLLFFLIYIFGKHQAVVSTLFAVIRVPEQKSLLAAFMK